jgi:hypothetical protein
MAFGENSFLGAENGADMLWNPTSRLTDELGNPLMGGMHPIYVFSCNQKSINNLSSGYDFPAYIPSIGESANNEVLLKMKQIVDFNSATAKRELYGSLSWIAYPMLAEGQDLLSTTAKIKLRINKEYKNFVATNQNGGKPMYSWNMTSLGTQYNSETALSDVLKMINVVPNPYNAFSEYENSKLDTRIKITNLPELCTISIYSSSGKLIKKIKKDSPVTYQDWTLTNHANVPIASGVYLIHVEIPGIGETVLKAFIAMRQVDLQNM